jgi:hypothetical protein
MKKGFNKAVPEVEDDFIDEDGFDPELDLEEEN